MVEQETSPAHIATSARSGMTRYQRWLWLIAIILVQLLYLPINRMVQGGIVLRIPLLDDLIPIWPIWVIPYLLSLAWWGACLLWAAWKMEDRLYRALMLGTLAVMLSSYLVYLVFPTYILRRPVEGTGWAADLLRWLYNSDRVYNAFPSGHTYTTVLITLFWWRWQPRLRWLCVAIAVVIVLSTLFTGQHHLPDPLGGIVFAYLGYRFGLWWVAKRYRGG
jgi:membrane-associated phospholipid phosphatase